MPLLTSGSPFRDCAGYDDVKSKFSHKNGKNSFPSKKQLVHIFLFDCCYWVYFCYNRMIALSITLSCFGSCYYYFCCKTVFYMIDYCAASDVLNVWSLESGLNGWKDLTDIQGETEIFSPFDQDCCVPPQKKEKNIFCTESSMWIIPNLRPVGPVSYCITVLTCHSLASKEYFRYEYTCKCFSSEARHRLQPQSTGDTQCHSLCQRLS